MRIYVILLLIIVVLSHLGFIPAQAQARQRSIIESTSPDQSSSVTAVPDQDNTVYLPLVGGDISQQTVSPAIVGGVDADEGEWPWQVFVLVEHDGGQYTFCGGSLIEDEWVLTAAHCITKLGSTTLQFVSPDVVDVRIGEHDLRQWNGNEQYLSVSAVIPHPDYDANHSDSDLALLRLSTPAVLGSSAATVSLVTSPVDDPMVSAGVFAVATGWGATSTDGPASDILQEVDVPIVSNNICDSLFAVSITDNMLCAGYGFDGPAKDTCYGDSGGPLVVSDGVGGWKLAGITSFGPQECATLYGVYTRVSRFTDWIYGWVAEPEISSFSPTIGQAGTEVVLLGTGFNGVKQVLFGDASAQFTVHSDSEIVATVPEHAKSGLVRLIGERTSTESSVPFTRTFPLSLSVVGPGSGYVSSLPGDDPCYTGAICTTYYAEDTFVELNAVNDADKNHLFAGWLGDCSGAETSCSVQITASKNVTAVFSAITPTLTVEISALGGSAGQVESSPDGIECDGVCEVGFDLSASVTLTATAADDAVFVGWEGACSGTKPVCIVNMMGDQSVTARFEPAMYPLTVTIEGEGFGTVTSFPGGIVCGEDCSSIFANGSTVNLTALPDKGSLFDGWSGACEGMSRTCAVLLHQAQSAVATFKNAKLYLPSLRAGGM